MIFFHSAFLLGSSIYALRPSNALFKHKVLACFLLLWFNLVITAHSLSLFHSLNNLFLYVAVSCSYSLIAIPVIKALLCVKNDNDVRSKLPSQTQGQTKAPFLVSFALVSVLMAICGSLLIAIFYYPNNFDAVAYRLARPFLYLGRGDLMHPVTHDFRISFYPLNAALAYIYFAIHQVDGRWFNFFGFLCWLISAVGTYVFARDFGSTKVAAFLAAAIFMTTPIITALATSNNDEVIAAAPVLIGIIFLHKWWYGGGFFEAVMGGIGLGLGLGAKLHWPFFAPVLFVVIFLLALHLYKRGELRRFLRARYLQLTSIFCLTAILSFPFLIINKMSRGLLFANLDELYNKPFSLLIAFTNLAISTVQLFLSPLPDVVFSRDSLFKEAVYNKFNLLLNQSIFSWVEKVKGYNSPYYVFRGVADPVGWWSFEQTFWLGFVPLLMLIAVVLFFRDKAIKKINIGLWLIASFFAWHLSKSIMIKYTETMGAYYAYPFCICAAGIAVLWDFRIHQKKYLSVLITFLFAFVIGTNSLFVINLLLFNVQRNIHRIIMTNFSVQDITMSEGVLREIKRAKKIHLVYTRWEFPFFDFMNKNPGAQYTSDEQIKDGEDLLNLMLYPARSEFGHIPIRISNKAKERLTILGTMSTGHGNELVFGKGNGVGRDNPEKSKYVVLHPELKYAKDNMTVQAIRFKHYVSGAEREDNFEYRLFQVLQTGDILPFSDWATYDQLRETITLPVAANSGYLKVQARMAMAKEYISEAFLPLTRGKELDISKDEGSILTELRDASAASKPKKRQKRGA